MNCKKCNNIMEEGDLFCTNCGTPVNEDQTNNTEGNQTISSVAIVEYLKTYLKNPISFFRIFKEEATIKFSLILGAILAAISGIINIVLARAVVNSIAPMLQDFINEMAGSSSASKILSGALNPRSILLSRLDYVDLFKQGIVQVVFIVGVVFIILELVNAMVIKGILTHDEILFLSVGSNVPLVLGFAISAVATYFNMFLGLTILIGAFILSCITLFEGLNEYLEDDKDKVFIIICIVLAALALVIGFIISNKVGNFSIKTFVEGIKKYVQGLLEGFMSDFDKLL